MGQSPRDCYPPAERGVSEGFDQRWPALRACLFPLLLVMAWRAPAHAAPPACAPAIVGPWSGKVWDAGLLRDLRTLFSVAAGELTGTYQVEDDSGGYDGTLTDFVPSGPCAGTFRWSDRHGEGVVWVDFRPDRDRFDGAWGTDVPLPGYIFNGRRVRPIPLS